MYTVFYRDFKIFDFPTEEGAWMHIEYFEGDDKLSPEDFTIRFEEQ